MVSAVLARVIWLLCALFLLGAPLQTASAQSTDAEKSIILLGNETVLDFELTFLTDRIRETYSLVSMMAGADKPARGVTRKFHKENDDLILWVAFFVEPGSYVVNGFRERAETEYVKAPRPLDQPTKTTNFVAIDSPLRFDVGVSEIVYIGTVRSKLTTEGKPLVGSPRVQDAKKSYELDTEKARQVIEALELPDLTFRQVDIFENRPEARALFDLPWSARPMDE